MHLCSPFDASRVDHATYGTGGSQGHEGRDNSLLHLVEKNVDLRKESKKT